MERTLLYVLLIGALLSLAALAACRTDGFGDG
jgi:hypothetical protein